MSRIETLSGLDAFPCCAHALARPCSVLAYPVEPHHRTCLSPLEGQALALAPVTSRCSPGHAALHCTALLVWPNVVEMENSSHQYCNRALTRSTRFVHLP
jgi:hypothetical protein